MTAERTIRLKAAALGMALGVVFVGLAWSLLRGTPAVVTALAVDGTIIGYVDDLRTCNFASSTLADRAGSVEVKVPWGEVFDMVAMTCDGSDPRRVTKSE